MSSVGSRQLSGKGLVGQGTPRKVQDLSSMGKVIAFEFRTNGKFLFEPVTLG